MFRQFTETKNCIHTLHLTLGEFRYGFTWYVLWMSPQVNLFLHYYDLFLWVDNYNLWRTHHESPFKYFVLIGSIDRSVNFFDFLLGFLSKNMVYTSSIFSSRDKGKYFDKWLFQMLHFFMAFDIYCNPLFYFVFLIIAALTFDTYVHLNVCSTNNWAYNETMQTNLLSPRIHKLERYGNEISGYSPTM